MIIQSFYVNGKTGSKYTDAVKDCTSKNFPLSSLYYKEDLEVFIGLLNLQNPLEPLYSSSLRSSAPQEALQLQHFDSSGWHENCCLPEDPENRKLHECSRKTLISAYHFITHNSGLQMDRPSA